MASTKIKQFKHNWSQAEYLVMLQVNADQREEICDNIPMRQSLVACVLECARSRGIEVPDTAYEGIHPALAEGIRNL